MDQPHESIKPLTPARPGKCNLKTKTKRHSSMRCRSGMRIMASRSVIQSISSFTYSLLLTAVTHGRACRLRNLPPAQGNEGAFAASGTNIALFGSRMRGSERAPRLSRACCARRTVGARGESPIRHSPPDRPVESFRSLSVTRSMA